MADGNLVSGEANRLKARLPWFVKVSPEFYDDAYDTGYGWEGWAADGNDAVAQALKECHLINDRDPEDGKDDLDQGRAKVHVAEIDFRRFAGPLVHWARSECVRDAPLWKAMEAAVAAAGLPIAPFDMSGDGSNVR